MIEKLIIAQLKGNSFASWDNCAVISRISFTCTFSFVTFPFKFVTLNDFYLKCFKTDNIKYKLGLLLGLFLLILHHEVLRNAIFSYHEKLI